MTLPRNAVADVAHHAVLVFLQRLDRYDPYRSDLLTYLVHIADCKLRDWIRTQQRLVLHEIAAA